MVNIRLPVRLDANHARKLIECARDIQSEPDAVIDASFVDFAYPFGVTTLAAAILRRERAGLPRAGYTPPSKEVAKDFLREVGFDSLVATGNPGGGGTLLLRRASASSLDPNYAHAVAVLIEREVPNTSESVAYFIEMALKEMLQNVIEHAGSTTDAIVLARWYQLGRNVRIAIADSGIGFAASLKKNPANAGMTPLVLVRRAVTVEGTTGRTAQRFGGLGLKHLFKVCADRSGGVHVTSADVDAQFAAGQAHETPVPLLDGTTVEVDFRPGPDDGSRGQSAPEEFF